MKLLHAPLDGILIFGTSLCIVIPFLMSMVALHCLAPEERRFWTQSALALTTIYAVFVIANYVVQLATVLPAQAAGRDAPISLLAQTPHSMFWDFDAVGYILMGLAMWVAIPAFDKTACQRKVRIAFAANALATPLISIVYFYPVFSEKLLMVGGVWAITAPAAMLTLALMFRGVQVAPSARASESQQVA